MLLLGDIITMLKMIYGETYDRDNNDNDNYDDNVMLHEYDQ